MNKSKRDKSIIDILIENGNDLNINYNGIVIPDKIPYWRGGNIHSQHDIEYATPEQKIFYFYFKSEFLKGKLVDIDNNVNYAIILHLDLLDEYETHYNLATLERQFRLLSKCCPQTEKYNQMSLKRLFNKKGVSQLSELFDLMQIFQEAEYLQTSRYSNHRSNDYKLGDIYGEELDLDEIEIEWLNKFWQPSNVFLSIDDCTTATVKQYLLVLWELDNVLKKTKSSIKKEERFLGKKLYKRTPDYFSDYGFSPDLESVPDLYLTVFKRVENSVRFSYEHKRKISDDFPSSELASLFESRIGKKVNVIIEKRKGKIKKPNHKTQIELNTLNNGRWKVEFAKIKTAYAPENIEDTIKKIALLEKVNQENPKVEQILFEASKLVAEHNNVLSLQYYIKYIYYDLSTKKSVKKPFTKKLQKILFKTEKQHSDFQAIIAKFNKDSNLEKALNAASKIYIVKRKKIVLNKSEIDDAKQKHDGTVELLNQYLEDDDKNKTVSNAENKEVSVTMKTNKESDSQFITGLQFNDVQKALLLLFVENSFLLEKEQIETLAVKNGLFKNQLIDSINEACFDFLDGEALIEEDDNNYVIEESFYTEILK